MSLLLNVLLYLWQLPQNLLAHILLWFYKEECVYMYKEIAFHICPGFPSGISLGCHAIVKSLPYSTQAKKTIDHEWGHTRQSRKWGWLYLIVIGLPSLLGNIYDRLFHKKWTAKDRTKWYYSLPWENSADSYGGVWRG